MLRHPAPAGTHAWRFLRTGGIAQVALETAEDLLALPTLDQKLWVALSCPTRGIDLDQRTLELLDTDRDGFIRVPEVLHAVEWAAARLKHPASVLKGEEALTIDEIDDATDDGRVLVASAREILRRIGRPDGASLAPGDFAKPEGIFPTTTLNGDCVLAPSETDDAEVQALIRDILGCVGGEKDRSGTDGVSREKAQAFFDQLTAYLGWVAQSAEKDIAVLGDRTAAACSALAAVRPKVNDYFARCRLAAFDARAIAALNRQESEFLTLAAKDLSVSTEEIAAFPIARVNAQGSLPLFEGANPAWSDALATFQRDAVAPIFGADKRALTAEEWTALNAHLSPYDTWLGKKTGTAIERLGVDRAKTILGSKVREKLDRLFAEDKQLQPHFDAISSVERLVFYHRDLRALLHNFVNFSDFFSRDRWAVFQAGKLYLDSRACELCVEVADPAAHAGLATMSKAYIAYVECRREKEKMHIAACFTQGDSDYLFVGRNGVFYDRRGHDWQATITKIVDNPISLREAFWSPYKKAVRAIEEQVAKRAAAADSASVTNLTTTAMPPPGAPPSTPPPPPKTPGPVVPPKRLDLSSIIGLSVALGSIGTFLATIFAKFVDLPLWEVPLVLIGLMFVVSLPSVLIAWMKLRQRNLGPILEANGWAINGRVKINVPFGTALTERARLPVHAHVEVGDPYASGSNGKVRLAVYGLLVMAAAVILAVAYRAKTWPFGPGEETKQEIKHVLEKPVHAQPAEPKK